MRCHLDAVRVGHVDDGLDLLGHHFALAWHTTKREHRAGSDDLQQVGTSSNGLLGLVNLFSGGALLQLSIFALGIMPYITASIIVQLLRVVIPHFETLYKEGQAGQSRLTQYTRYLTIALGVLQSTTLITVARSGALFPSNTGVAECSQLITNDAWYAIMLMVITMTAGTGLIMWMGELITERGSGHGMSVLIFASVISSLPTQGRASLLLSDAKFVVVLLSGQPIGMVTG